MDRIRVDRVHDGYSYVINQRKNDTTYLVCKRGRHSHCHGRGKIRDGIFVLTRQHNHAADGDAESVEIFRHELREACMVQYGNQKAIYDRIRILHPEAAVIVTYASIESSMRRWRKTFHLPIPRSLRAYGDILLDPQWRRMLEYNDGRVATATLIAADNSISVVFGSENFIALVAAATEIFVDATFKVVPAVNGAYQLLTFMATRFDHALPFAWALMSSKTKAAYDSVIAHVRTTLAPDLQPTSFMTDFETGLRTSLHENYEEATPHGCFCHHCQALYRKARSLRVTEAVANIEEGKKLLRTLMVLALLPANSITEAFNHPC